MSEKQVAIVTGATSGIGKVTAHALAAAEMTVIVAVRDLDRGETTVEEIKARSGATSVVSMKLDLSSQESIRGFTDAFKKTYTRLDVLVNNAGALNWKRGTTVDGLETTFATNHLGPFLLTNLLLDVLKASSPSRIVNVASMAARGGVINFDDLQGEHAYAGMRAYSQSKLANILFTAGLSRRLQGTGVTANALHPGFVATGFGMNNGRFFGVLLRIIQRLSFALPPEKGAETEIYLATSPEVAGVTGKYFDRKKPIEPPPAAKDDAVVERLWTVSEQLTRLGGAASRARVNPVGPMARGEERGLSAWLVVDGAPRPDLYNGVMQPGSGH